MIKLWDRVLRKLAPGGSGFIGSHLVTKLLTLGYAALQLGKF